MIHARHPCTAPAPDIPLLGHIEQYAIEAAMHEVDLRDGSLHALHYVCDPHDPEPRSRALRAVTFFGATVVVDLTRIAPALKAELPAVLERDRAGLIKYTLRALYPTAPALRAAIYRDTHWLAAGPLHHRVEVPA